MRNEKVDDFLAVQKRWQVELTKLRMIALDCHLEEGFKWMHPCYLLQGKNICLIHGFKEYVAIMFMKSFWSLLLIVYNLSRKFDNKLFNKYNQVNKKKVQSFLWTPG